MTTCDTEGMSMPRPSPPAPGQQGPSGGYGQHPGAAPRGGARNAPPPPPPPRGSAAARAPASGALTRVQALAVLGLVGNPTEEELRKAYKHAALSWHPDRRQNHDRTEEAKANFQNLRAAFDLLQADL